MHHLHVDHVETVGGEHVPGAGGAEVKEPAADKRFRRFVEEERQWVRWRGAVEKVHVAMALDRREGLLPGEGGRLGRAGRVGADAVGAEDPAVKGAADGIVDDAASAKVGAEVGTARVEHERLAVALAIGDQPAAKHGFRMRSAAQQMRRPEQVPGRGGGPETLGGRGLHHGGVLGG